MSVSVPLTSLKNVRALYEFVLLLVEFQLVYKRLGPDSSSVMTGFVLESFSGRVLQCETTNEKLNMGNITMPEVEQDDLCITELSTK
jgi:hypothetical protein